MKHTLLLVAFFIMSSLVLVSNVSGASLPFTRNEGQIDTRGKADCRFYTKVGNANFFLCADGIVEDFQKPGSGTSASRFKIDPLHSIHEPRIGHVLKLNFVGRTNFLAEINGEEEQEYKCNYFLGNDPMKWHRNVSNYSRIVYKDVWEGIDVMYYGTDENVVRDYIPRERRLQTRATLKYDVIVHPGADPSQIHFQYEGDEGVMVNKTGALVIRTSLGEVIEQKPYVYQIIDGQKRGIETQFLLTSSTNLTNSLTVTFSVGEYDKTKELVIDPVYSTFLGGAFSDYGSAIAVDASGNAYVTGYTQGSGFPTTPGAYQTTYKGVNNYNAFVIKLNPTGSALYSTFLGGTGSDWGIAIAVDASGNAYITGYTQGSGFPITSGAYQTTFNGNIDGFVTKLNPNGTNLLYSTFLGGSLSRNSLLQAVTYCRGIAVDRNGYAYVTGYTICYDFPTTPLAYQIQSTKKSYAAFVTKFNPDGSAPLVYSTFLGGSSDDYGYAIVVDTGGNAYITGQTTSADFPTTSDAYQTTCKGGTEAFVTKLNPAGSALGYSTFLGGSRDEQGYGIVVDAGGNAYITGTTGSSNFPTTSGAYQTTFRGGGDAFVTKLNPAGSGLYSTFLGGSRDENGYGIVVDAGGNAYITGYTYSSDFPITLGAYQTKQVGYDIFITKVNPSGSALGYSTFYGGSGYDYGYSIAVDVGGDAFITGSTTSSNFPTTTGAFQTKFGSYYYDDAFVTKFSLKPAITVADTLNFNSVHCSESQTTLLIENFSVDGVLKIDTMTITGPNSANFSFVDLPKFPLLVSPLGDTQLVLQLTRNGAAGKKTAALNIHSNDITPLSDTLKKVTLTGVIDSVGVITLQKKITFGQLRCEEVSYDTVVQVKNTGTVAITIVPTLSGQGATSFKVSPNDTLVPAGGIGKFRVHFQPSGNGSFSAHIQFSSNDCGMISDTAYVSGSKKSDVTLSSYPSLLDFGEHCHSSVVDSFITVHNTSSGIITLDPATLTGNGFTILKPTGIVTLGPDSSIQYQLRFTSSGVNNYQSTLSINAKPCNIGVSHQLRGTEIEPPKITLSNTSIDFGTLDCTQSELFSKVKVRNVGTRTITIKSVVTGDTAFYRIAPDTAFVLHRNEFRNVTITFHPDSGQSTAYLFFADPFCGLLKDSVTLVGFKSVGAITGSPLSFRFDTIDCVAGGYDTTLSIWIKNTGSETLNLNSPTISGKGFTIEDASGVAGLAPGDSVEYYIHFSPNSHGTYTGTFTITGSCNVLFTCSLVGVCRPTSVVENNGVESARVISLSQNHPNPFSQSSVVSYQLSGGIHEAVFEIRDMLGRIIAHQAIDDKATQLTVDASNLPNGLYLYSLSDGVTTRSRMMMVVK